MELLKLLRANLDPSNPAGRALQEYRLNVSLVAGELVLRIHPEGFNAAEQIYTLQADFLMPATEEILAALRAADAAAKLELDRARDLALAAERERERDAESQRFAQRAKEELAAAALARPADISKGTVEP